MIPHSLLFGYIYTNDLTKVEIRVLELAPDFFTFRLPLGYDEEHGGIKLISLSFLAENKDCNIYDFKTEKEECEYWTEYVCRVNSADYSECAQVLTKDYLGYIAARNGSDLEEFSNTRSSYPLNENNSYAENLSRQFEIWRNEIEKNTDFDAWDELLSGDTQPEICLALEDEEAIAKYLKNTESFQTTDYETVEYQNTDYLKNDKLINSSGYISQDCSNQSGSKYMKELPGNHPLRQAKIKRVYVGNPYCFCMRPDVDVLKRMFICLRECGMGMTLVLPPISQSHYKAAAEYLEDVIDMYLQTFVDISFEISLNDYGMLALARNMVEEKTIGTGIKIDKGILLYPFKRDPRKKYMDGYSSSNLMRTSDTVFAPFYQTNTGTFCTLKAAADKNRGAGRRMVECDKECLQKTVLYPLHLNMIGKYNCLLGFDVDFMKNPRELIEDIESGKCIRRLVLNW